MSAIRRSAKGQECQIRYVGVCNHNPETVVWCHANGSAAGKGIGMKSLDPLGAYACSACHDLYDRRSRGPMDMNGDDIDLGFWEGHARSLQILVQKGLVAFK